MKLGKWLEKPSFFALDCLNLEKKPATKFSVFEKNLFFPLSISFLSNSKNKIRAIFSFSCSEPRRLNSLRPIVQSAPWRRRSRLKTDCFGAGEMSRWLNKSRVQQGSIFCQSFTRNCFSMILGRFWLGCSGERKERKKMGEKVESKSKVISPLSEPQHSPKLNFKTIKVKV